MSGKENTWYNDSYGMLKGRFVFLLLLVVLAFLFGGLAIIIRQVDHHYEAKNCAAYSRQWNRPTKFVNYNYWSYDCLTKVGHQWLPTSQVRVVVNGG